MLRKGIVALMIAVMSVGTAAAQEKKTNTLMGFLRGPSIGRPQQRTKMSRSTATSGGVRHAVIEDAERQVPEIRQTSGKPQSDLQPAESAPQPTPIQYAPAVPNASAVMGPQYFSASTPNGQTLPVHPAANWQQYSEPVTAENGPMQFVSMPNSGATMHGIRHPYGGGVHHLPTIVNSVPMGGGSSAALYPAPKPGIPHQVGGTAIVHHALQPHEMLYPHKYKAMYGPYYYKVNGHWMVTPFGVWSKENWKLQGTQVDVKYKSYISPWAKFNPPIIR